MSACKLCKGYGAIFNNQSDHETLYDFIVSTKSGGKLCPECNPLLCGKPKMVEKWYVWDGKGKIPRHALKVANSLNVTDARGIHPSWWLHEDGDALNFYAYTLGEMVPSKRGVK